QTPAPPIPSRSRDVTELAEAPQMKNRDDLVRPHTNETCLNNEHGLIDAVKEYNRQAVENKLLRQAARIVFRRANPPKNSFASTRIRMYSGVHATITIKFHNQ